MEATEPAGDGLMATSETNACDVDGASALQPPLVISNGGVKEECYDECTDDEQVTRDAPRMVVAMKKYEDVDTDDESSKQTPGGAGRAFLKRVEELKAYKAKHGHLKVKRSEDKSLVSFCRDIRYARRNPERSGRRKLTEEDIASLDALGFDWGVATTKSFQRDVKTFEERLEELTAYQAKHGHINVKPSEDESLAQFCANIRSAGKGKGTLKLNEDRITSLNAIGFKWTPQNRKEEQFQERMEELEAYKAEHGHLNVKESEDKSLNQFCQHIRKARRGTGSMKLTKERIAALDALGFNWAPRNQKVKSFQERIEELKAYKDKHGHVNVTASEDKGLAGFCKGVRWARKNSESGKGVKLTEDRVASLDALGFHWEPQKAKVRTFQERLEELKAYKARHGHLNVKESEGKSLAQFCSDIRYARRQPESSGRGKKLTADRIAALDALDFDWGVERAHSTKTMTFEKRLEALRAYKAKYGHLKVKESEDKSLAQFCFNIRRGRRNTGTRKGMKLTVERIASLDALGFDWEPQSTRVKSFQERLDELRAYKAKHGHLNVKKSEDRSLYDFCNHVRRASKGHGSMKLDEERIASLKALEFKWEPQREKEIVSAVANWTKSSVDKWLVEEKGER